MSIELKIKLKSLAEEARIIRIEERKVHGMDRWRLQHHRKTSVRSAARHTLLAYAFLRGIPYWKVEAKCDKAGRPDLNRVHKMVIKYGGDRNEGELEEWLKSPPPDTTTSHAATG